MKMRSATQEQKDKMKLLRQYVKALGSVAVAFSGGVDSTFLLKVSHEELGENCVAVTARSCSFPERELEEAKAFCEKENIRHLIVESEELEIEGFCRNLKNRCYLCKRELFEKIGIIAKREGLAAIAEGSNLDDNGDYRPGLKAVEELGIKSPLRLCQFDKQDIRALSKELGLTTWDKQSFACLSSRFVYGETITREKLSMVDRAEQMLLDLGFHQVRVRVHGKIARIEFLPEEFDRIMEEQVREDIYDKFQSFGFSYVALDLRGYRTGSMNETL